MLRGACSPGRRSLGAIVAHHAVKLVYRRPRPAIALSWGKTEPAFPSGHTADASAVLLTSAWIMVREGLLPPGIAWPVAVVVALVTGISRVALGLALGLGRRRRLAHRRRRRGRVRSLYEGMR